MIFHKSQKWLGFLLLFMWSVTNIWAQQDESKPKGDLLTPYDAVFTYTYYMQSDHLNETKAATVFYTKGKAGKELALKLKQILDGKGQKMRLSMVPEAADFMDSVSKKHVYIPFAKEFPEIYLERQKETGRWHFSYETEREIPVLHKKVFPFGSDLLLNLLPKLGQQPFMGLALWQYFTILILLAASFLGHFIIARLFIFLINIIANSRLGKDHFDKKLVKRIGRILSYLLVTYAVYVFVPVLQLPTGLGFYILLFLRLANTTFVVLLALRTISFIGAYLQHLAEKTTNNTDEHLVAIVIKVVNVLVITAGVFHALSIFYVNVTALIAGLSIGGLAIALAAQETVKNLIGSMMIYADRPFKIGDIVTVGGISGTIEDIGFRSTRIRTFDTSLISVPNGNLMNETIDNLGQRQQRRLKTTVSVAYHTPLELVEIFIAGLHEVVDRHPETDKEKKYIHLNHLGTSSLDIIFVIYFNTNDWAIELKYKEEIIFAILHLANTLGVQIAYPSSSLYIESMPEKESRISDYKEELALAKQRLNEYFEKLKQKYPKAEEETELEAGDD